MFMPYYEASIRDALGVLKMSEAQVKLKLSDLIDGMITNDKDQLVALQSELAFQLRKVSLKLSDIQKKKVHALVLPRKSKRIGS